MRMQIALSILLAFLLNMPARTYTFNFTSGQRDHWVSPPGYRINTTIGSNIAGTGARSVTAVINSAFASWANAPNAAMSATFLGTTGNGISSTDGQNVICFTCSADFTKDNSTLAVTTTSTATSGIVGQLLDADIAFNPGKSFSTDNSSGQDLETVAVHEIGHFFGLSHSGIVKAVMFAYAPSFERDLGYDDVAAFSALYPGAVTVPIQRISGTVRLGGAGVFGAHVYAESQTTATPFSSPIRKTPISALTDTNGAYVIQGLPNDTYIIVAEPLDDPTSNAEIPDYAKAFGRTAVQTNFTTRWH